LAREIWQKGLTYDPGSSGAEKIRKRLAEIR